MMERNKEVSIEGSHSFHSLKLGIPFIYSKSNGVQTLLGSSSHSTEDGRLLLIEALEMILPRALIL